MTTRGSIARGQGAQQVFTGRVRKWTKKWVPSDSAAAQSLQLLKWVPTEERPEDADFPRFAHLVPAVKLVEQKRVAESVTAASADGGTAAKPLGDSKAAVPALPSANGGNSHAFKEPSLQSGDGQAGVTAGSVLPEAVDIGRHAEPMEVDECGVAKDAPTPAPSEAEANRRSDRGLQELPKSADEDAPMVAVDASEEAPDDGKDASETAKDGEHNEGSAAAAPPPQIEVTPGGEEATPGPKDSTEGEAQGEEAGKEVAAAGPAFAAKEAVGGDEGAVEGMSAPGPGTAEETADPSPAEPQQSTREAAEAKDPSDPSDKLSEEVTPTGPPEGDGSRPADGAGSC